MGLTDGTTVVLRCGILKGGRNSNPSARWIDNSQAEEIFHRLYDLAIGSIRHRSDEKEKVFLNCGLGLRFRGEVITWLKCVYLDLNDPILRAKLVKGMGHNYYGEPAWSNDLLNLAVLEPSINS
ncbi:hypothetical protein MTR_2g021500 [Medicago truncatula]|uniref:Uncharacterized protein n=1 Tax=Medicago truncatula TaxID=3880 RepID=G7IKF4_MEDTR|nr:hypothetical protein MTR_2g021500 [Medicago truncatula]